MRSNSHFRSEFQKYSRTPPLFGNTGQKAWGHELEEAFEPVRTPKVNVKPLFEEDEEIIMNDQQVNILAYMVYPLSPTCFHVQDAQGFFHIAELLSPEQSKVLGGAQLRALVAPFGKFTAGYKQNAFISEETPRPEGKIFRKKVFLKYP